MDSNRQQFWQLSAARDWAFPPNPPVPPPLEYDAECRRLRLRDRSPSSGLAGVVDAARRDQWRNAPGMARDAFGTVAYVTANGVFASGAVPGGQAPIQLFPLLAGDVVTDLALGYDDVLYIAFRRLDNGGNILGGGVGMLDRRRRWTGPLVVEVVLTAYAPERLTADPQGGVWVLGDRVVGGAANGRQIAYLRGMPLRDGQPGSFSELTFRPDPENPTPPALQLDLLQPQLALGEDLVGLAANTAGALVAFTWLNGGTRIHERSPEGRWNPPRELLEAGPAVSLTWLSANRLGVIPAPQIVGGQLSLPREVRAYDPSDPGRALAPVGGFLPLRNLTANSVVRLVNSPGLPAHYVVSPAPTALEAPLILPLLPLSVASFERSGSVEGRVLDSRLEGATWHRIYLEGIFPPGCGAVLELAAADDPFFVPAPEDWQRHEFGQLSNSRSGAPETLPARGVWLREPSEFPAHDGLLGRAPERDRAGLFTALIQRPGRRVRALRGRFLRTRLTLQGTGHTTPEIAAVRFHGARFSYRDHYLAELYRETLFGDDADQVGTATGADFLERFLSLFEGVLTPWEDRVANAHLWTHPAATPADALEWLGAWIGVVFEPAFDESQRRAWLAAAPRLFQTRGTVAGLQLALEIATGGRLERTMADDPEPDQLQEFFTRRGHPPLTQIVSGREVTVARGGGVTGGEILVLEDFRLRRVVATILGANLSAEQDPLLPGLITSGNSHVGDTLVLGDEAKKEFLALFRQAFSEQSATRVQEQRAALNLFDRLAHRVTILVHQAVAPVDQALIQRIAEREVPAHVQVRVARASEALILGLSSLVAVDTYLGLRSPRAAARVGRSRLGEGDSVQIVPSLDPRQGGGRLS